MWCRFVLLILNYFGSFDFKFTPINRPNLRNSASGNL